jgi:multicomponent Na+:H+ antiporter subunit B
MLILILALSLYSISVFFTVFSQKTVISLYFFSFLSIPLFVIYQTYNASDVALTEIIIGSFLSFFIFYTTYRKTSENSDSKAANLSEIIPMIIICVALFFLMIFLGFTLNDISSSNTYSMLYNKNSYFQTNINNTVTAILASYRGFDTLGETLIIAISSLGLPTILNNSTTPKKLNLKPL